MKTENYISQSRIVRLILTNLFQKNILLFFLVLNFSMSSLSIENFSIKKITTLSMFRIKMAGLPSYLDECVFYYQAGSTNGFDSDYDAYKITGFNPVPSISIDNDSLLLSINGIPAVVQTYSTMILATTNITGNFTITAADIQGLPAGTCVFLKDLMTNTTTNLLLNNYTFNLSDTTSTSRFMLTITYNTMPIVANIEQPLCSNPNGGKLKLGANMSASMNYFWKDTSGTIIKTTLGSYSKDSLIGLNAGSYSVEIVSTDDACLRNEMSFNITSVIVPTVNFSYSNNIVAGTANNFSPTNLSVNCSNYLWNFGDALGCPNLTQNTYCYSNAGLYKVKLVGISNSGCSDSITKTIEVISLTTFIASNQLKGLEILNIGKNNFLLKMNPEIHELDIKLYSLNGKLVYSEKTNNQNELLLDFNHLSSEIFILDVMVNNTNHNTSKVIIQ